MQRLSGFMRTYWSRGPAGRPTPRSLNVFMQRMWLLALFFKLLGSSWDVSWHFKWLRDDLAPPHLINTVGTGIAIGLVLAHSFTGYGVEKRSLRLMQLGTGIFVIAGPIDIINHRVNGLDLTSWSPSHLLLYIGTAIMIAGVIRNWYRTYPRDGRLGWQWTAGLVALWAFMFEDVFFPQLQQEYGILEVASWFSGNPYGEQTLLDFAANQIGRPVDDIAIMHFAMPIPTWVYPVFGIAVCVPLLVFARMMTGFRWTATCAVGGYLAYRLITWPLLVVGTFPPSSPPLWLLPVAIAVDVLFLVKINGYLRAVLGAVVVTGVGFGALALHALALGTPLTARLDDGGTDARRLRGRRQPVHPADRVVVVVGRGPRPAGHLAGGGRPCRPDHGPGHTPPTEDQRDVRARTTARFPRHPARNAGRRERRTRRQNGVTDALVSTTATPKARASTISSHPHQTATAVRRPAAISGSSR